MNFQPCISSGEQTASAIIYTGECYITKIKVVTDATNDGKVIVYDGTSTSGTVVDETTAVGVDNYGGGIEPFPIKCSTGIYVAVSGTGASYFIQYIKESPR